jgi:DNA-binding transcriptional MerR regulator
MVNYSMVVTSVENTVSLGKGKTDGNGHGRNGLMWIGELANRAGITLRTVRYYEELGLINHAVRTKGGFRLYDDGELRKLEMIRDLQELDFPLSKIRSLFARKRAARSGADLAGDLRETLAAQLRQMDGRIARYQALRAAIVETMDMVRVCAACQLHPTPVVCGACPLITGRAEVPLPMRALISVA